MHIKVHKRGISMDVKKLRFNKRIRPSHPSWHIVQLFQHADVDGLKMRTLHRKIGCQWLAQGYSLKLSRIFPPVNLPYGPGHSKRWNKNTIMT